MDTKIVKAPKMREAKQRALDLAASVASGKVVFKQDFQK